MNIIELHERVRFWLDMVSFPRVQSTDIDNALNISVDNLVREKYDQSRLNNRGDSFQRTQRVRDELKPIVRNDSLNISAISAVSGLIANSEFATDYRYLLCLKVKDTSSVWYNTYPLTYDKENVISQNPFRRPQKAAFPRVYYNEIYAGIRLVVSGITLDTTNAAMMYYLGNPDTIVYGVEYDRDHTFTEGNVVYAVDEVVYDSVTYPVGSAITIVAGHLSITSGTVVYGYTNCNLPVSLHNEITKLAASYICEITGAYEKAKSLKMDLVSI